MATGLPTRAAARRPAAGTDGAEAIAAFDIGGTWFRSGLVGADGTLTSVRRTRAISFVSAPDLPPNRLRAALVDYLVAEVERLREEHATPILTAGISMGAALDGNTGTILNSGPLWGSDDRRFDLAHALGRRCGDVNWVVINDITAALMRHVMLPEYRQVPKVSLLTVSSGVGLRTWDGLQGRVPMGRQHGLQGEIGHLAVRFEFRGRPLERRCDCGELNHLNAFCSGRGIEAVLRKVAERHGDDFRSSALGEVAKGDPSMIQPPHLALALARGDRFASEALEAVTLPVAECLLALFTLDPEVERVILTGGVVHGLGERYRQTLIDLLSGRGLYQISRHHPSFFSERIWIGIDDGHSGLLGAAIACRVGECPARRLDLEGRARRRWSVRAQRPAEYAVIEADDLLDPDDPLLMTVPHTGLQSDRRLVVVDDAVDARFGLRIRRYLESRCSESRLLVIGGSEARKDLATLERVLDGMNEFGLSRHMEPVIAIGGGVVLDIVGFAASLFRRGIPYIRVPTTLLAYVDAAVGVKTGVNFGGHKNLIGSYHPPLVTLLDCRFLCTLPARQVRNGLAEIAKLGLVRDARLFELLERHGPPLAAGGFRDTTGSRTLMRQAITGMVDELRPNLWEKQLERLVDFGHSFSPAIEMAALPDLLHGEAVTIDMALSVILSAQRGLLSEYEIDRILVLFNRLGLPIHHPVCTLPVLLTGLEACARHRDGLQRIPLPTAIGEARFFNDVQPEEVARSLERLVESARGVDG